MPRLIMIEGPRSGDCFQLSGENFLGHDGAALCFGHRQGEARGLLCSIRGGADRFELRNMGPPERVRVNGEGVRQAWLHHGDLISIVDSLLIFDSDDHDGSDSASGALAQPPLNPLQSDPYKSDSLRIGAIRAGEDSENMLGTVSIRREDLQGARENINYRQKHYENDESVLGGIKDAARIRLLYKVSAKVSAILDLQQLLNEILDLIFEHIPADRGSVLLFDDQNRRLRTMASKTRGGDSGRVRISKTIVKEVLRTKDSLLTAEGQGHFDPSVSMVNENIRSALCVPLVRQDRILGIIFLDTASATRQFQREDCDLLTAIAMQAAMALENARLIKEMGDRERLKHELSLAATIQKQLLPKRLPRSNLVEVYGKMIPAKEMSGDYFDFMDHEQDGDFHICIGDVSGKGLPAGLVMIMARSYFRPLTRAGHSPSEILLEANRLLFNDTRRDVFMSALVLHWSDETGRFVWSGAGHEHLVIYRARTRRCETIKAGGCVLAAVREPPAGLFKDTELLLDPGDSLVLYTDGVTEAKNPAGDMFELEQLERLVELYGHLSAKDLLEAILWELKQFIAGAEQADDITVVTVKRPG